MTYIEVEYVCPGCHERRTLEVSLSHWKTIRCERCGFLLLPVKKGTNQVSARGI